ncbi:hypothetical protein Tco_1174375 [Tanacetum coccineum]
MRVLGSPPSRVILFGDIPTVIPSTSVVAPVTSTIAPVISSAVPMAETTLVASPTGLCGWFLIRVTRMLLTVARCGARVTARPIIITGVSYCSCFCPLTGLSYGQRSLISERGGSSSSSSSSSSDSSPVHSLGLDAPDRAHSGSSTRDVAPRLCYPPRRAPRRSEAFSSLVTVISPTLLYYCADLSPPRKRFRDLFHGGSIEEDAEVGLTWTGVDMELDASAGDMAEVGIDPMTAPLVEEEIVAASLGEDLSDSSA